MISYRDTALRNEVQLALTINREIREISGGEDAACHKTHRHFVSGKVFACDNKESGCLSGAKVTLQYSKSCIVMETVTDLEGTFAFSDLPHDAICAIRILVPGYKSAELTVELNENKDLGIITLEKL